MRGIETVCEALMKAVRGGDLQQENIWLLEKLLTIFERHNEWLYGHSMLVQVSFYGFLRLMADHCSAEYRSKCCREGLACLRALL